MNIEEYKKIKSEVDKIVAEMIAEFNYAIDTLRKDSNFVKIRLLIPFLFAEMVCINFDKYYDIDLPPADLMKRWFKEYCLTKENNSYVSHPYFQKIDQEYLYQLRCSLVHAFALPEHDSSGKLAIMFVDKGETTQRIKDLDRKFSNAGAIPVFISPDAVAALIMNGAINLHKEIFVDENKATEENLAGLKRMLKEFHRRGACTIPL